MQLWQLLEIEMITQTEHESYLGAKGGSGVYQAIINVMAPHDFYGELFLGTGVIFKKKAQAKHNVVIDKSQTMLDKFNYVVPENKICGCAIKWLQEFEPYCKSLLYLDPPYMPETRTSNACYEHEMTEADHKRLLLAAKQHDPESVKIIISGYDNPLYNEMLKGWWRKDFQAMTRGGVRTETIWLNYQPGDVHYHTYAGENFTDRQRIKRKAERWAKNFKALPPAERQSIMAALLAVD